MQVMEGFGFQVEVVRTNRKRSASIQLDGELVKVRVPKSLSDNSVRDLISKKMPWIQTKLKEYAELPRPRPKEYVGGEAFPYLGKNYRLKVISGQGSSVKLKNGYLVVTVEGQKPQPEIVKSLLEGWYRSQATIRLQDKAQRWSKIVGVSPLSVSVRGYRSQWGSCSIKGAITYNWRIVIAPHHIVDYVVVHELCHLLEHNHSQKYWRHVERHVPDWRVCREWLKSNPIVF